MIKKGLEVLKVVVIVAILVAIVLFCAYNETHYYRVGFIKHTDTPYLYTFTDSTGNMWEFVDYNLIIPYNTIVKASVQMYTNNTLSNITDDEILDIEILSISKNKK